MRTFRDLRNAKPELLRALLGNQAERFRRLAAGIDTRPVEPEREDKSVSAEETFERDVTELARLETDLLALTEKVAARLRRSGLTPRTVTLKIRESGFITHTRSHTFHPPGNDTQRLYSEGRRLLRTWWREHPTAAIRLVGIGTSNFAAAPQADLFAETAPSARPGRVDSLVDSIREKFGSTALVRGRLLDNED